MTKSRTAAADYTAIALGSPPLIVMLWGLPRAVGGRFWGKMGA